MLDQLFNAVGGNVINSITEKTGLDINQAKAVLPIAQETVSNGLMDEAKSGNIGGILNMLNSSGGALQSNSLFGSLKSQLLSQLLAKLGLPASVAGLVAGTGMTSIVENASQFLGGDSEVTKGDLMDKLDMKSIVGNMAKDAISDKLGGLGGKLFGK
jgi:hypothetical protein